VSSGESGENEVCAKMFRRVRGTDHLCSARLWKQHFDKGVTN